MSLPSITITEDGIIKGGEQMTPEESLEYLLERERTSEQRKSMIRNFRQAGASPSTTLHQIIKSENASY